jgi:hypothetical protein
MAHTALAAVFFYIMQGLAKAHNKFGTSSQLRDKIFYTRVVSYQYKEA